MLNYQRVQEKITWHAPIRLASACLGNSITQKARRSACPTWQTEAKDWMIPPKTSSNCLWIRPISGDFYDFLKNTTGWWCFLCPSWKMMEWKSMGRILSHIWNGKIKFMFQSTNQETSPTQQSCLDNLYFMIRRAEKSVQPLIFHSPYSHFGDDSPYSHHSNDGKRREVLPLSPGEKLPFNPNLLLVNSESFWSFHIFPIFFDFPSGRRTWTTIHGSTGVKNPALIGRAKAPEVWRWAMYGSAEPVVQLNHTKEITKFGRSRCDTFRLGSSTFGKLVVYHKIIHTWTFKATWNLSVLQMKVLRYTYCNIPLYTFWIFEHVPFS